MHMNVRYTKIQSGTNDKWILWLVDLNNGKYDNDLDELLVTPVEAIRKVVRDRVKQIEQSKQ